MSSLIRQLTMLDTVSGPNSIRQYLIPTELLAIMRIKGLPHVNDANERPINTLGILVLLVRLGYYTVKVDVFVCSTLAAPFILGCDFFDRFAESIPPRTRMIVIEDGIEVPIVRRPLAPETRFLSESKEKSKDLLAPK